MSKKMKLCFAFLPLLLLLNSCHSAKEQNDSIEFQTRMDSISYIIGYDYGKGIQQQEIKASPLLVSKGIIDALKNDSSLISDSLQNKLISEFNKELEIKENQRFQEMLAKNKENGKRFLDNNKLLDGVNELPSGLQYRILKLGSGKYPAPTDSITIHYRAMYIDKTTFDMSYDEGPVGITLNKMVKGLTEGIRLMQTGGIYEFYIPPHLAYGDRNYLDLVPAGSTVIYTIELIKIH